MDLGPELAGRLAYLLKRAQVALAAYHEELLAPSGVSHRELGLLLFLDSREPGSQQEAARRLGVDRTTMVGLIDALERKGLVMRRAVASDRRRNVVEITAAGLKTLRQATRASDRAEQRLLADLDDAEAAELRDLLQRLTSPDDRRDHPDRRATRS